MRRTGPESSVRPAPSAFGGARLRRAGAEGGRGREIRVRLSRRASERRQVDARERPLRRQGRDRLGQAADDPAADLRDRERGRLPARARRPAGVPAAARPAHRAHAADRRRVLRGRRGRAVRAGRARADRCRRPLHRREGVRARRPGRDRAEQGRPPQARAHRAADADRRAAGRLPRAPSGLGEDRRRRRRAARRARRPPARRARSTSRSTSAPTSRSRSRWRSSCARRRCT